MSFHMHPFLESIIDYGPFPIHTAGSDAMATEMGLCRFAIEDENGNRASSTAVAYVIPTQREPLIGTNSMDTGSFSITTSGRALVTLGM